MPLPTPVSRTLQHTRKVICEGYQRDDGLWDIEGHLTDIKSQDMAIRERNNGILTAGEPLHGMSIRITIDLELNIIDAHASMDYTPFRICPSIAKQYRQLIGLQIAPGFNRKIRELFSGTQGCTHLLELLGPIATTAYQATHQQREQQSAMNKTGAPPPMLNSCHAFDSQGSVVEKYWPEHFEQIQARELSA